jgi:glycyl-tRNA synthetase
MTEKKKTEQKTERISIEEIANFCKSKGFVFRSSDIYGGFTGFWDLGPLGVELMNNIKKSWWDYFVHQKGNMVGMEASIISHPRIWKASGHIDNFNINDYLVTCLKCKKSTKIDKPQLKKIKCGCGGEYDWEKAKMVEQMFRTKVGTDQIEVFLRGETAQGMFSDFKLIQQTTRKQLPFGIAQIGRCFRNEIAPRDFLFRSREFHIGELEFFINPEETKCNLLTKEHLEIKLKLLDAETQEEGKESLKSTTIAKIIKERRLEEWHAYWLAEQIRWFNSIGLTEIKVREHMKSELSHYSSATFDLDYEYSFGSKEIAGIANRGQYDLNQHQKESGESMEIFDEIYGKKVTPKTIEPTFGIERVFLAILTKAYHDDKQRGNIVLKIPARLAPIKVGVFPLVKNETNILKFSKEVYENVKKEFYTFFDSGGSIGRRYARADEIGIPYCITIDGDFIKDKKITIRERDTTKQIRVPFSELKEVLRKLIFGEIDFEKAGKLLK